jgi:O-succinylhomoserine sulfhydrylase
MTDPKNQSDPTKRSFPWSDQTEMVHGGTLRSQFGETSEAIFPTSGYVYDSAEQAAARFTEEDKGFTYSRFENPTVEMFEQRMARLEGAEAARGTASGMAAVTAALLSYLSHGDHIVAAKALFGSCRYVVEDLCPRFGITTTLIDGTDNEAWERACQPNTKAFFLETPSNPTLTIVDLKTVCDIARSKKIKVFVDNVFATPILQKPLEYGAHVVIYSATKHIDGQGRCLGGVVLSDEEFILETLRPFIRNTGPCMSPFNAWVLVKSLETLDLRINAHCDGAQKVADFLGNHKSVTRVFYPERNDHPQQALAMSQMKRGSTVVAFEVKGGKEEAFRAANGLEIIKISNNLGDAKSLVTHPATTTDFRLTPEARAEFDFNDGLLRLSVGLEDPDDLCQDIENALKSMV